MALSNMQVFNEYLMPATIEQLGQMVDKFNGASAGAITLSTGGFTGDYLRESFFQTLQSAQRRVDRNAAQASASATDLTELEHSMVKVAGGFGPIRYEPSQMTWLQRPTQEGISKASESFAQILMQDQLNTAIASAVAAISNQAAATNDVSGGSAISYSAINGAHAKFGDASSMIVADVMSGACAHKLIGDNLANGEQLFVAGNVTVLNILGKAVIVTDAPALTNAALDYKVLSLAAGGLNVNNASDIVSNVETTNGQTRIETTFQVDYSFGLGLKGYTWDQTNGGASPSDAALATGSNWDKVATDIKHTAGVIAIGDQA